MDECGPWNERSMRDVYVFGSGRRGCRGRGYEWMREDCV